MPPGAVIEEDQTTFNVNEFLADVFANPPQDYSPSDGDDDGDKLQVRLLGVRKSPVDLTSHYYALGLNRDPKQPTLFLLFSDADEERRGDVRRVGLMISNPVTSTNYSPLEQTSYSLRQSGDERLFYFDGPKIFAPNSQPGVMIRGTRLSSFRRSGADFPTAQISEKQLAGWQGRARAFVERHSSIDNYRLAARTPEFWQESMRVFGGIYDTISALFPSKEGFYEQSSALMPSLALESPPLERILPNLADIVKKSG